VNTLTDGSLRPARLPDIHVQCVDDDVVDGTAAGDEEYRVFFVGRLKGFAQARGDGGNRGDFHQHHAPFVGLAVGNQGIERVLCHRREVSVAAPDTAHANGCEEVLALVDGVIYQWNVAEFIGFKPEQNAAGHGWPLDGNVWVTEGEYTAACLLALLARPAPASRCDRLRQGAR